MLSTEENKQLIKVLRFQDDIRRGHGTPFILALKTVIKTN
jgi:hypothetical protein